MAMVQAMPVAVVARMVDEWDTRLWRIIHHDKFHLVKLINEAVDAVRRAEQKGHSSTTHSDVPLRLAC